MISQMRSEGEESVLTAGLMSLRDLKAAGDCHWGAELYFAPSDLPSPLSCPLFPLTMPSVWVLLKHRMK